MTPPRDKNTRISPLTMRDAAISAASTPVLARDADATYWMSRYVERAEHVARLLLVHGEALVDVGDVEDELIERHWQSVLDIMHVKSLPGGEGPLSQRVAEAMTFDPENPNSLVRCLTRARENARGIREVISTEMWEHINTLYWSIRADDALAAFNDMPDQFYQRIITGSMLFQGLTDQTLIHGQRWYFAQLGKCFERITGLCRILQAKHEILRGSETVSDAPLWNVHWTAVLRSCGSIEAYRRTYLGEIDAQRVAHFLMLEEHFPRSIRFCVRQAHEAITAIRTIVRPHTVDPTEHTLGRLRAQLEYSDPAELTGEGLPETLRSILNQIGQAALNVQHSFFLH